MEISFISTLDHDVIQLWTEKLYKNALHILNLRVII